MRRLRFECSECDATLLAPTDKITTARLWAEETHGWVAVGRGASTYLCPEHTVACTRCGHHNTTRQEIAVRRGLREEAARVATERRAFHAKWRADR